MVRVKKVLPVNDYEIAYKVKINRVFKVRIMWDVTHTRRDVSSCPSRNSMLGITVCLCFFLPQSNPKADVALMQNLLRTPSTDSMCGVTLNVGDTYVLNGRIVSGKALISYCGLSIRWADTTTRQRKGLRQLYQQGCVCDVSWIILPIVASNLFSQLLVSYYREIIYWDFTSREYHH